MTCDKTGHGLSCWPLEVGVSCTYLVFSGLLSAFLACRIRMYSLWNWGIMYFESCCPRQVKLKLCNESPQAALLLTSDMCHWETVTEIIRGRWVKTQSVGRCGRKSLTFSWRNAKSVLVGMRWIEVVDGKQTLYMLYRKLYSVWLQAGHSDL